MPPTLVWLCDAIVIFATAMQFMMNRRIRRMNAETRARLEELRRRLEDQADVPGR